MRALRVNFVLSLALWLTTFNVSLSFQSAKSTFRSTSSSYKHRSYHQLFSRRLQTLDRTADPELAPFHSSPKQDNADAQHDLVVHPKSSSISRTALTSSLASFAATTLATTEALAVNVPEISQGYLDPASFNPVCPASDFFYRFLQSSAINVVGRESFIEYGPLIAGGLLRVRLELCVVESFFNEAVIPFIKQNGLNWVLPLHETVETFLAGTVFAIATTFILVGSTKILIVIATYTDFLIGLPFRLFGGFAYDRAMGKPVTLDIGFGPFKTRVIGPPAKEDGEDEKKVTDLGPVEIVSVLFFGTTKFAGQVVGVIRDGLDALDVFVGRYLVLWASLYIAIKFLHFKVFPDFP